MVTGVCVSSCGQYDHEVFTGKLLRVYSSRIFLSISRVTRAVTLQEILHYALTCLNHLMHIAPYGPAKAKQVGAVFAVICSRRSLSIARKGI